MYPSAHAFAAASCSDLLVFLLDMNNAPFVIDSVFISLSLIKGAYHSDSDEGCIILFSAIGFHKQDVTLESVEQNFAQVTVGEAISLPYRFRFPSVRLNGKMLDIDTNSPNVIAF